MAIECIDEQRDLQPPAPARAALADAIDGALPQTQCTRCGYPDCRAYANAIAFEGEAINRCPPGGAQGVARLARLTGRPALPLDPAHGVEAPRMLAIIDEAWCIGCTLCLKACPVDAIAGGNKAMHTVLEAACTGCELCVPVCPVDCISLEPVGESTGWAAWSRELAQQARERYEARSQRLHQSIGADQAPLHQRRTPAAPAHPDPVSGPAPAEQKSRMLADILARAKARRER